jgi:hypothetical protein
MDKKSGDDEYCKGFSIVIGLLACRATSKFVTDFIPLRRPSREEVKSQTRLNGIEGVGLLTKGGALVEGIPEITGGPNGPGE